MTTIDISSVPSFYQNYVRQVQNLDVMDALRQSNEEMMRFINALPPEKENFAYDKGKWTVKELLCHVIDAERIFVYRALRFSRNDKNNLPGFDENAYVPESNAVNRSLDSIRDELRNLRTSTIDFFKSCDGEMMARTGFANNTEISVLALAYVVSGHEMHHLNILKQRYLK
jgi:uncharacterized damage-inducible protein DinB